MKHQVQEFISQSKEVTIFDFNEFMLNPEITVVHSSLFFNTISEMWMAIIYYYD